MNTVEYLKQIEWLDAVIQDRLDMLRLMRKELYGIPGQPDGERVQSGGAKDKVAPIAIKMSEQEERISKLMQKKFTIIGQIEGISNLEHYKALHDRYVLFKNWTTMAEERGQSERQVKRTHGKSVLAFEKKYGTTYITDEK